MEYRRHSISVHSIGYLCIQEQFQQKLHVGWDILSQFLSVGELISRFLSSPQGTPSLRYKAFHFRTSELGTVVATAPGRTIDGSLTFVITIGTVEPTWVAAIQCSPIIELQCSIDVRHQLLVLSHHNGRTLDTIKRNHGLKPITYTAATFIFTIVVITTEFVEQRWTYVWSCIKGDDQETK